MEGHLNTSTEKRCTVVTGGNRGIGYEICRQLASTGIDVILTARNEQSGKEAVENLKASGLSDVLFHQLDVKDPASISSFAKFIQTNFKKLDILINNAAENGIIYEDEVKFKTFKDGAAYTEVKDENADLLIGILKQTYELAQEVLKTNYFGVKRVTEALLPFLQLSNSPRIVNVSSGYGKLEVIHNEKVKEELSNVESLTEERIDEIVQWFLKDFKEEKLKVNGWPLTVSAYKISKVAVNAYTRLLARKFPKMLINCVNPGYVVTDMTCKTGHLTPEEGARGPVMVALLPDGGFSGLYFNQMHPSSFL